MIITREMIAQWIWRMTLDRNRATRATRKNHKHIFGEQFKSISHSGISPSEYRNRHASMQNGRLVKITKRKRS